MRLALAFFPTSFLIHPAARILLFALIILPLALAGCGASPAVAPTPAADTTVSNSTAGPELAGEGMKTSPTVQAPAGQSAAPAVTPTPDTRLKPKEWQEWPAVPEVIPAHLVDVYRKGLELGNDPTHFSRVGDCQSIQEALLGMFERGKPYRLQPGEEALEETIAHFAGSFARDGQAVQGGYNAASVLSPLWANPDVCKPGETPLDCELRTYQPSFMVISLEIAFPGRTTEAYEKYMRRIIERALEQGVVPILLTKADNVEGDHSINLATARLAYEYDIPLVNWWLHAQGMPNRGFDPERDDGFHISMEAWTERSLLVLKTLDLAWRSAAVGGAAAPEQIPAPTADAGPAPEEINVLALPGVQDLPAAALPGADQVYFGLAESTGGPEAALGVFRMDPYSGAVVRLLEEGFNLQAVSPDGSRLLVNKGAELYLAGADGSNPVLLTSSFYNEGRRGAAWSADGSALVFIAAQAGGNLLVHYPLDGGGWQKLTTAGDAPRELLNGPPGGSLFVDLDGSVRLVSAPGLPGTVIENAARAAWSPDGRYTAVTVDRAGDKTGLVLAAADGSRETPLENIGDHIIDTAWSPDGQSLAVLTLMVSEYSGQWYDLRSMVITPADMGTRLLPAVSGLNARATWSPDGGGLLFTSTVEKEGKYRVQVGRYEFSSGATADLTDAAGLQSETFLLVTNIFWR